MIIECLIDREGPTIINDGGFEFVFEKNDKGRCIGNVLSEGSAKRLLNFDWFIPYVEKKEVEAPEPEVKAEIEPLIETDKPKTDQEMLEDRIMLLRDQKFTYRQIGEAVGKSKDFVGAVIRRKG